MIYQRLSKRQRLAMLWWTQQRFKGRDGVICDGSIRSGKSLAMTVGFVLWAMSSFDSEKFAICGKTVESLRRNIIINLRDWLPEDFEVMERRSENKVIIGDKCGRRNVFFLFGGRDESSYSLVQGITLAGALLDEVALMPRSFVEQVMGRCSVVNSKIWFNCNPESPSHWFFKEWIEKSDQRNMLHLHFTMEDNYSLADSIRKRYESMFSGVFYDRYIRGLWVMAEGLIYPMFDASCVVDGVPAGGEYYISCDYGTLNPFSAGLWCWDGKTATRVKEYYYSGRETQRNKTDAEYYEEIEKLAGDLRIKNIIVDPSAASFIEVINRHKKFPVRKAKNDVLPGIMTTARYLQDGTIKIHESCKDSIREFGMYRWDEKSGEDRPIKENDHAMDDIRYFCQTVLREKVGKSAYKPIWN